MLKADLEALGSHLLAAAHRHAVPAGGALAVDREAFARDVTARIEGHPLVDLVRGEAESLAEAARGADALVVATGPLTSGALAADLARVAGAGHLAFYDAAAPIVMADSLDGGRLFRQSRYEDGSDGAGDYLNAPFTREEYEAFAAELVAAERVVLRDFETRELFQACQPIEEIARKGLDAPRFGPLKPVGLTDPRTGRRPWAALQLRAEDAHGSCYNLVGCLLYTSYNREAVLSGDHIRQSFSAALPIMLGYVAIGIPCGILCEMCIRDSPHGPKRDRCRSAGSRRAAPARRPARRTPWCARPHRRPPRARSRTRAGRRRPRTALGTPPGAPGAPPARCV